MLHHVTCLCLREWWMQVLTEGDLTDLFSISVPCWPCRQAVSFLWVLCVTCLTRSRRFSTWKNTHTHTSETSCHTHTDPYITTDNTVLCHLSCSLINQHQLLSSWHRLAVQRSSTHIEVLLLKAGLSGHAIIPRIQLRLKIRLASFWVVPSCDGHLSLC